MQKIKTNIKFYKGLNDKEDKLYGFVTKSNGSWRGCRNDVEKKKIVFVDSEISDGIVPNVLYSCSLIPMLNDKGFVAKSASVVKFTGTITAISRKDIFLVTVKFETKLSSTTHPAMNAGNATSNPLLKF